MYPVPSYRPDTLISERVENAIQREVVGQPRAVHSVTRALIRARGQVGVAEGTRGALLFLGPTGTGKSHICRVLAQVLHGPQHFPFTLDCQQLRDHFETLQIAQALRLWPGELHDGTLCTPDIVVFDRLDAAPEGFKKTLLSILDHGYVPAADGGLLDFRNSLCILLSNLCSEEILKATEGRIGFDVSPDPESEEAEEEVFKQCFEAAENFWGAGFMSRVGRTVIFRQLQPEHICRILDLKIGRLRLGFQAQGMDLIVSDSARDFLVAKSVTDLRYGAWRLQQTLEKYLEYPLSDLLISGQLCRGTGLYVSRTAHRLHFQSVANRQFLPFGILDPSGWRGNGPYFPRYGTYPL